MKTLSTEALRHWLVLQLVPKMGVATFNKIAKHYPLETFLNLPASQLASLKLNESQIKAIKSPNMRLIERFEHWHTLENQHILCLDDPRYPETLKHISCPPMLLFVKGDPAVLTTPQLAIIGSRDLTITGQDNAFNFAKKLALLGITITSGLAIGVDGFSHKGALAANGKTIAVLGTGVDQIYPKRHKSLAQQISTTGAVISEFMPDQTARPENFPRRNRIIAGLSQGTLVIEAAIKSGSLITAKYAMEQDREVFAVPGSIQNPMSKGCHWLIKQGAKLVENTDDIIEEIEVFQRLLVKQANQNGQLESVKTTPIDKEEPLLKHIGYEATAVDCIAQRSLLPVHNILAQLLVMELAGLIAAVPGGYIRV
jgi:DNA processing protein